MLCHWRYIGTRIYKRWGVGGVKHSKNISENNYIVFQKECLQKWNMILGLSIFIEVHIAS